MIRMLMGLAALMLVWMGSASIHANSRDPILPKGGWPRTVTALGETEEKARDIALREAAKSVTALMRLQEPPLTSLVVTEDYVRRNLIQDQGKAGKEVEVELADHLKKITFKEWTVTFRSDYSVWWKDLVQEDQEAERHLRAEERIIHALERQTLAARMLAGLTMLLLGGFSYVRLDRYTHHRHTAWLRVAGVGLASLVLAGLWLILQGG